MAMQSNMGVWTIRLHRITNSWLHQGCPTDDRTYFTHTDNNDGTYLISTVTNNETYFTPIYTNDRDTVAVRRWARRPLRIELL